VKRMERGSASSNPAAWRRSCRART
jgi:hypothetical protein